MEGLKKSQGSVLKMNREMNKKKIIVTILLILSMLLLVLMVIRCVYLNMEYPNPAILTTKSGNVTSLGNYEIALTDWRWGDGEIIHEVYPGYHLIEIDGEGYPIKQERVGLAEVTIHKVKNDSTSLDLSSITFESGAWGNQFDFDLFMYLNPNLDNLILELSEDETITVTFPITMLDIQFSKKSWENIDSRHFFIVIQYYPEKRQLACN